MRKSKVSRLLLVATSLCVCGPVFSQDSREVLIDTLQDTVPHCGTVDESGPLCYQSRSDAKREALIKEARLKAIEMLKERKKKEKLKIDDAKDSTLIEERSDDNL